jgi:hypothetical protein
MRWPVREGDSVGGKGVQNAISATGYLYDYSWYAESGIFNRCVKKIEKRSQHILMTGGEPTPLFVTVNFCSDSAWVSAET